ncbi:type IV secretory system conjugative DNA transfer family protein [Chryseobacterium daecheongense]|nr:type IV secretory system conjugative DNA transfer family protein [Chryseobacterium daecheongense]
MENGFIKSMMILFILMIIVLSVFYGVKILYEINFGGWIYGFKIVKSIILSPNNINSLKLWNLAFCIVMELLIYWIELFFLKLIFPSLVPVYKKYTDFIFYPFRPLFTKFSLFNFSNSVITKKSTIEENSTTVDLELMNDGKLTIPNPYRGILVIGGAGSGKSESIAVPLIREFSKLDFTGIVYDFKFPALSDEVETFYRNKPVKHFVLNLNNAERTHRVNPLHPKYMPHVAYAREYATAIIKNLMKESIKREDFWSRSATDLLTACIWYMKQNHPHFCDLPHIFSLITSDHKKLIELLSKHDETRDMIISLATALVSGAGEQIAGVVGSLQGAISQINTPEFMYIFGADEFSLDVNDPNNPIVLTVGSNPTIAGALSPLCSLVITVASKQMNTPERQSSFILLDESPTVFIPNIEVVPNTGRSNKISTVLFCQDLSQLNDNYGKEKAEVLFASCLNHFYGRVASSHTADILSKQFGKEDKYFESKNTSRSTKNILIKNYGKTYAVQEREIFRNSEFMNLPVGVFIGKISDSSKPFFYEKFKTVNPGQKEKTINNLPQHSRTDITNFYKAVKADISDIFNGIKSHSTEAIDSIPKKIEKIEKDQNVEETQNSDNSHPEASDNSNGNIDDELTRLWNNLKN